VSKYTRNSTCTIQSCYIHTVQKTNVGVGKIADRESMHVVVSQILVAGNVRDECRNVVHEKAKWDVE
jgi:hypothetical protein